MERIRARANGLRRTFAQAMCSNGHVARIDGASRHFRDAIAARDRMIDDREFAPFLHFCPRSSVAAWRIAFRIGK